MADLTLTTADKVNVDTSGPNIQFTGVAGAAITAGSPVCFDGTNDRLIVSDANNAAADAVAGIATRTVATGESLTCVRIGYMSGWSNLPVPGKQVFVSDTGGALADAAGTVGIVVPVFGAPLGTAADRILLVQITGAGNAA
jgi:hypothetical protein